MFSEEIIHKIVIIVTDWKPLFHYRKSQNEIKSALLLFDCHCKYLASENFRFAIISIVLVNNKEIRAILKTKRN